MKLETVCRVSMSYVGLKIGRQIYDVDSSKWTLLRTNATTNTQSFGDEGNLGFRSDFDAKPSASHYRARFLAFLSTFLHESA